MGATDNIDERGWHVEEYTHGNGWVDKFGQAVALDRAYRLAKERLYGSMRIVWKEGTP